MLLQPGDEFAGYVIRAVLGHGGSSEVYRADHPDEPGSVALKILGAVGVEAAKARFLNEFAIAGALQHPNIVRMCAHGEHEGRLWLAAEYIDGAAAAELVPAPRASPDLMPVLDVLAGIAAGLDYAHAHGVVHLDVKPSNMLVGQADPNKVVLTDFGAACRLATMQSAPVSFIGSIPYSAPELLRGETLYPATDQYSLACAAVELLTGRPPFPLPNRFAIEDAHLHARPVDVSWRQHWIPHAVDSILDKALAKDPLDRYGSCAEPIRLVTRALRGIEAPQ